MRGFTSGWLPHCAVGPRVQLTSVDGIAGSDKLSESPHPPPKSPRLFRLHFGDPRHGRATGQTATRSDSDRKILPRPHARFGRTCIVVVGMPLHHHLEYVDAPKQ